MMGPQTYDEAIKLYRAGDYSFDPPPVCSARWTEADWIMSIWGLKPSKPVCPNCGQWQDPDCLNECKKRGFA